MRMYKPSQFLGMDVVKRMGLVPTDSQDRLDLGTVTRLCFSTFKWQDVGVIGHFFKTLYVSNAELIVFFLFY